MDDFPRSIADRKRKPITITMPPIEDLIQLGGNDTPSIELPKVENKPSTPSPIKATTLDPKFNSMDYDRLYIAEKIITNYNHANSRSTILITDEFKDKLDLLSGISGTNICCLVNNILALFLSDESRYNVNVELRSIIQKQHSKLINKL